MLHKKDQKTTTAPKKQRRLSTGTIIYATYSTAICNMCWRASISSLFSYFTAFIYFFRFWFSFFHNADAWVTVFSFIRICVLYLISVVRCSNRCWLLLLFSLILLLFLFFFLCCSNEITVVYKIAFVRSHR